MAIALLLEGCMDAAIFEEARMQVIHQKPMEVPKAARGSTLTLFVA